MNTYCWYGDGGSGTEAMWGEDNWWIKCVAPGLENNAGFNRLLQDDFGCAPHSRKANYCFADGHAALLNANKIPCNLSACWWSLRRDFHSATGASAARQSAGGR